MNRRGFLIAASAATVSPVVAMADESRDDFRDIVQAAFDGDAAYAADPLCGEGFGPEAHAYEAALIERTYGPPFQRLCEGDLPAPVTAASAALGLRYCLRNAGYGDQADEAIITAVLAFLETGRGAS